MDAKRSSNWQSVNPATVPPSMIARSSRVTPTRMIPTPPFLFPFARFSARVFYYLPRLTVTLATFLAIRTHRPARCHKPSSFKAFNLGATGDSAALRSTAARRVPAQVVATAAATRETTESGGTGPDLATASVSVKSVAVHGPSRGLMIDRAA